MTISHDFEKHPLYFVTLSLKNEGDYKQRYKDIIKYLKKKSHVKFLKYETGQSGSHLHFHSIIQLKKKYYMTSFKVQIQEDLKLSRREYVEKGISDIEQYKYYIGYMLKEEGQFEIGSVTDQEELECVSHYKTESAENNKRKTKHQKTYDGTLLAKDIYKTKQFKGYDQALAAVYLYSFEHNINVVNPDAIAKMLMQMARIHTGKCGNISEKKILMNDITSYL